MNDNNFGNRLNVNGNNWNDNDDGYAFGIALLHGLFIKMKTYKNIYSNIYSLGNLTLAWRKARKNKTKKLYVIEFEENLIKNLLKLHTELKNQKYSPQPLETFILRDPKTRKISKSDFRDRIVYHAICNIIEPIFDKTFIYDNCANRKEKGNLFAIKRLSKFMKKVSRNGKSNSWFDRNQVKGYCLKADVKHYFQNIDHEILLRTIKRKIVCGKTLWLITRIIERERERERRHDLLIEACLLEI